VIKRQGYAQPSDRGDANEVYIPTVPAAFMLRRDHRIFRHKDWGENTDHDIRRALQDLSSKGMKRLLYDIRGNPGGPIDRLIKTGDESCSRQHDALHARRIPNSDQDYRATEDSLSRAADGGAPNRNSASASEIFTRRHAGPRRATSSVKPPSEALVQSVYRISAGAGPRAHDGSLFTPSAAHQRRGKSPSTST